MTLRLVTRALLVGFVGALFSLGCRPELAEDICSANALTAALSSATRGSTIRVGRCTITGSFVVPEGVTLQGRSISESTLRGETSATIVTLRDDAELSGIGIEGTVPAPGSAVSATDATSISISGVRIRVRGGVALRLERVAKVNLALVSVHGGVTAANAAQVTDTDAAFGTHGVYIRGCGAPTAPVILDGLSATGFATAGLVVDSSHVLISHGRIQQITGTGLGILGGTARVEDTIITEVMRGGRTMAPYAVLFARGATVDTTGLGVSRSEGYGVVEDGANTTHHDLTASDNGEPGLWVQNALTFELAGTSSRIEGNKLAGIVLVDSPRALIRDAMIARTQLAPTAVGGLAVMAGDGVLIRNGSTAVPMDSVEIRNVTLVENGRVGLLIDVARADLQGLTVSGVSVDATGAAHGAIAQGPAGLIRGWDVNVTRRGAAIANDGARNERFDVLGYTIPIL